MSEAFDCAATASFLESGKTLAYAANAAALLAGLGCVFGPTTWAARATLFGSLLCWSAQCWFALRVTIDASLFRALSADPDTTRLDKLLSTWQFKAAPAPRSLSARSVAALALWRRQIALFTAQWLLTLTGIALGWARF